MEAIPDEVLTIILDSCVLLTTWHLTRLVSKRWRILTDQVALERGARQARERGHLQWRHVGPSGDLGYCKVLLDTGIPDPDSARTCSALARYGHLEVLQHLHNSGVDMRRISYLLQDAAAGGHLHVVEWLKHKWPTAGVCLAVEAAAACGHLPVVQHLDGMDRSRRGRQTSNAMALAAARGHLPVVQWLHERGYPCTEWAMDDAAGNGHLAVVVWLHEHRTEGCTTKAMDESARNGHLDVVRWLHAARREGCTQEAMTHAVVMNRLDVVAFLREERRLPFSNDDILCGVQMGHVDLVRYMHQSLAREPLDGDGEFQSETLTVALERGLDTLARFLIDDVGRRPSPEDIITAARARDWPEMLEHLLEGPERVGPFAYRLLMLAIKNDYVRTIEWLVQHPVVGEGIVDDAPLGMWHAVQCDSVGAMEVLHRFGAATVGLLHMAAENGRLRAVKWLMEHGVPCSEHTMDLAATNGHLAVVKWLHRQGAPCTTRAVDGAARRGHHDVVRWLLGWRTEGYRSALIEAATRGDQEMVATLCEHPVGHQLARACAQQRGFNDIAAALTRAAGTCATQGAGEGEGWSEVEGESEGWSEVVSESEGEDEGNSESESDSDSEGADADEVDVVALAVAQHLPPASDDEE